MMLFPLLLLLNREIGLVSVVAASPAKLLGSSSNSLSARRVVSDEIQKIIATDVNFGTARD